MTSEQWLEDHGFECRFDGGCWQLDRWRAYQDLGVWFALDKRTGIRASGDTTKSAFANLRAKIKSMLAELP